MTQKGESNHYNVKFLKGYGFSVSVKDNKIVLKNSYDPFKESEVESWYVKNMPYEKIVLSGKGYISTEALSLLCQNNRNLILLDTYGKPISYLNPVMESNTATQYRIGQYDTFRNLEKKKYLAKQIVKAKIESQIRFLESTKVPAVKNGIEILKESLVTIKEKPLVSEAGLGRRYFIEYSKLIPERYGFVSRKQSLMNNSINSASLNWNIFLKLSY